LQPRQVGSNGRRSAQSRAGDSAVAHQLERFDLGASFTDLIIKRVRRRLCDRRLGPVRFELSELGLLGGEWLGDFGAHSFVRPA
jgi:hypothetical protein